MRVQARLILGAFGLVFLVPGWMAAAAPGDDAPPFKPVAADKVDSEMAPHKHKGLFGWRHCSTCQRMQAKKQYGIDVPPPPSMASVAGMTGKPSSVSVSVSSRRSSPAPDHVHTASVPCAACQGEVMMAGTGPVASHGAAGYAVVGGPAGVIDPNAPGYAVVGGGSMMSADPAPIGVAHGARMPGGFDPRMAGAVDPRMAGGFDPRMAAADRRPGSSPYDPAVVPSSLPPGQVALSGPGHDRPHIIGHMLGIPKFGTRRRDSDDKERQKHAAIAYDEVKSTVTELPASMVYGKNDH